MRFSTLHQWLAWQEGLHPSEIDLGLDRVRKVWLRMGGERPAARIVTVAGTNGKGSSVALLEAILRAAGLRVGAYTSPHLLRYNERIRIDGHEVTDEALCAAFARVDQARGDISLTYFEFGTLAALDLFAPARLDVALLEVGMGGRLDAVNIVDPDVALVTALDVDHSRWLGSDRAAIGYEKAGIFRPRRPAVVSDPMPPATLLARAREIAAPLFRLGREYHWREDGEGRWQWCGGGRSLERLPRPALSGEWQLRNAAGALMTVVLLQDLLPVPHDAITTGLRRVHLAGRQQRLEGPVTCVVDVAHNPQAVAALACALRQTAVPGRTRAVWAMLADKDAAAVARRMVPLVDEWHVASLGGGRGAAADTLAEVLRSLGIDASRHRAVADAWQAARARCCPGDRIVVFGSFLTAAAVLPLLEDEAFEVQSYPT